MNNKKRLNVGFISNFCLLKSGFGRSQKALLTLLYKTGKYNLFTLCSGMSENHPEFGKLPWKSEGAMKNFDQQKFNQDPNYQRFVSYGNAAVEEFVVKNKLDVVIHQEDIWSSDTEAYLKSDWYKHIKQNFVQSTTADSLPILPNFKEWAKNCPNMWFWTSFAEKVLKEEDPKLYGHCKTVYGPIVSEDFYPLPQEERLALRNKFGIRNDEKIVIYLGRNQLRKLFFANLEGLAKFKKRHPEKKLKLLFHTYWSEPGGWQLDRIRQELKLAKEDVLATYYCRQCKDWNIRPFDGEDLNCSCCGGQKTRITAGITSTITDQDLNKIYNIADGSSSLCTSGALEYTNLESLLSGTPLGTVPYAGTQEFTPNSFVFTVKGTFTRECGTGFKKFVPDINSVTEFFEYIYNLTPDRKKIIVEQGRKWVMENFDAKVIAEIYERFIDSCQPIDWEIYNKLKKDVKNINAPVEDIEDNLQFILHCYKNLLNMNLDEKDSGVIHWQGFLKQPGDRNVLRQNMVNCFRQAGLEHNTKNNLIPSIEDLLNKNDKKRVLVVLPCSIGDIFLSTALFESIRNRYPRPEWTFYFATSPEFFSLLDLNPHIDKIIPYNQSMDNLIWLEGQNSNKGLFDVAYLVHAPTQKFLTYVHNGIDIHDLDFNGKEVK